MTDGKPTDNDTASALSEATVLKNKGVVVYTVGIGNEID
jgi:uncharacterized protein YegL